LKTALIDCDGVLADFLSAALQGLSVKPSEIKTWELFNELSPDESRECKARMNSPYFWGHAIKPYETALGFGDRLQALGYERIVILTSPWSLKLISSRMDWLNEHFGSQFDAIIFDSKKSQYRGDLFIDDKVSNVIEWKFQNPDGVALLFDQPYNREANLPRLMGWDNLETLLKEAA
jgi:5'(3')-deoxyribonucleotidase